MPKEEIARILKELRTSAGFKRKEIADRLGVSVKTIGHWETGYAQPDANTLFVLCDIYGTSVDSAFGIRKKEEPLAETMGKLTGLKLIADRDSDAMRDFLELTETDKEMVIGMIDRLKLTKEL